MERADGKIVTSSADFVKGVPIRLYNPDGTLLSEQYPENLLFYSGNTSGNGDVVTLYDDATGSADTITLTDSAANYKYIEIYFRTNDNDYSSTKVYNPNGKMVLLAAGRGTTAPTMYMKTRNVLISGTSISTASNTSSLQYYFNNAATANVTKVNNIYITRVVGYKDNFVVRRVVPENQVYSTAETDTGSIWVDGKPIYRKVITGTSNAQSWTVDLGVSNVDLFINVDARVLRDGSYTQNSNVGSYYYASTDYFNWYMSTPATNTLAFRCGSDWPKRPLDYAVIVEYTKITD